MTPRPPAFHPQFSMRYLIPISCYADTLAIGVTAAIILISITLPVVAQADEPLTCHQQATQVWVDCLLSREPPAARVCDREATLALKGCCTQACMTVVRECGSDDATDACFEANLDRVIAGVCDAHRGGLAALLCGNVRRNPRDYVVTCYRVCMGEVGF